MGNNSLLCVGLDPHVLKTRDDIVAFNRLIIEATSDLVCAFKPNLAIYEGLGSHGMEALERTIEMIPRQIPVIGDGKRGDIANCGDAYARRLFGEDGFNFDAVTVNPYMGLDAVQPFLRWPGKGVFVLCRTSNKSGSEIQELPVATFGGIRPLYQEVARIAAGWDGEALGFVVGATYPEALSSLRSEHPAAWFLIPGVGAQGGSLEVAVESAMDQEGLGFILSISRSIIYPWTGLEQELSDGLQAIDTERLRSLVREQAARFRDSINVARNRAPVPS